MNDEAIEALRSARERLASLPLTPDERPVIGLVHAFVSIPAPDFLLPDGSPTVVIQSKIGEDGGTVRDKAARIRGLAEAANQRGLIPRAVIDGKDWRERPAALVDVVIATGGRTFTLNTLEQLLGSPRLKTSASTRSSRHSTKPGSPDGLWRIVEAGDDPA